MYCRNGTEEGIDNGDNSAPVPPLYNLPKSKWWFQADRGCSSFPPDDGDFLELPAGGSFTVELANNRAFTTLSFNGERTSDWPDGADHPEDWNGGSEGEGCIQNGFMHTQNHSMAGGTAWAIAYNDDLNAIAMEDLVVFSVLDQ
ncbi:hypothetical protein MPH_12865 [Macrophomina phaseolina MS6]|uniref:Uncharacterized protein n=1 Tax=Macrophomina phaseolina (strain MS6) TaxID=1126212 RepID=K2R728_MACPH|nr:hypothetical protein MPH_12865 [Macrophomina phaseolina MS6]